MITRRYAVFVRKYGTGAMVHLRTFSTLPLAARYGYLVKHYTQYTADFVGYTAVTDE